MDNERLLQEAQLIAAEFKFYLVKGSLEHLYGYIYESEDGETKYPLEIKYTPDFPEVPPEFIFPQPIPNVPDEIELETLNNWTSESQVVDAVRELAELIKNYVENSPDESIKEKSVPEPTLQDVIEEPSEEGTETEPEYITPNMEKFLDQSTAPEQSEQYLTPDTTQYPYAQDEYVNPDELPQWTEEEQVQEDKEEQYITPDSTPSPAPSPVTQPSLAQMQGVDMELEPDVQVSTEAALVQQEFAIDYVGGAMGVIEVYLTITIEQTFIIRIDFSNYPKRPIVTVQENLHKILNDVNTTIEILKNWNERKPKHIVEVIREIETKLWFLSDIEQEMRQISGEYKTVTIDGLISNLRVSLFTYGFKEYSLDLEISKYPAEPIIQFSPQLQEILPFSPEDLMAFKNWKRKESHVVDILREISWLVDKSARISFEVDLLKGGVKRVEYDKITDKFIIELAGQLKTKDLKFEFEVHMNEEYPITVPKFKLLSELEGYEEIKEKIDKEITSFTSEWHPFNYLIDLFNQISKTIFAESIISCVICHKKITDPVNLTVQCPSCERSYHKDCWNQTILSFGKCGFCLRTPPDHMKPQM
jgi:ubiquitin-protein ligase